MKFELGKYYQHTTGSKIYIMEPCDNKNRGDGMYICHDEKGAVSLVGDKAEGWREIFKDNFETKTVKPIKFELGKYYQHTTGSKLYICGYSETCFHGPCYVGENEKGELSPVGIPKEHAENYHEITKEEFLGQSDFFIKGEME